VQGASVRVAVECRSLPGIAGSDMVTQQIELTRQKARISPGADLEIQRFSVVKVKDQA